MGIALYNLCHEQGTRIGVIGATAEYKAFYSKLGWQVTPPRENLKLDC